MKSIGRTGIAILVATILGCGGGQGGDSVDGGGADAPVTTNLDGASKAFDQDGADSAQVGLCPAFEACGGDVVGSWRLRSLCEGSSSDPCSSAAMDRLDFSDYNLVYTFNADGTLILSLSGELRGTRRYPLQCLDGRAGAAEACEGIQRSFEQTAQGALDAGIPSAVSTGTMRCGINVDGACVCSLRTVYSPVRGTGSYTVTGNVLKLVALTLSLPMDGGTTEWAPAEQVGYCVSGNTLTLGPSASDDSVVTLTR